MVVQLWRGAKIRPAASANIRRCGHSHCRSSVRAQRRANRSLGGLLFWQCAAHTHALACTQTTDAGWKINHASCQNGGRMEQIKCFCCRRASERDKESVCGCARRTDVKAGFNSILDFLFVGSLALPLVARCVARLRPDAALLRRVVEVVVLLMDFNLVL